MKHLKTIFACLLMAVLSNGQMWADATFTSSSEDATSAKNGISLSVTSGSLASGEYYRIDKGATLTISSTSGNIESIVFTCTSGTYAKLASHSPEGTYSESGATVSWSGSASEVTFTAKTGSSNKNFRFSQVVITTAAGEDPSVSLSPSSLDLDAENVANQSVTITASNFASAISSVTTGLYSDAECTSEITSGAWVKNVTVNGEKTAVTFDVDDNNTGVARECWLKVSATDGTGNASAAVHVAQKKIVVDYATLPFSFTGGKADIETTDGMTQSGLGSDYSATEKLKFDNTGDWLKIKINADPGKLSYQIKGNSFSGGTFTIQQSADDETYSDLATYTADGSVELALAKTTRYVKFIYTSKSSGNIGLGNIAISLPVDVEAPTISGVTPFLSSTEVTLTQNDADAIYYTTDEAKKENPSVDTWTEYNSASKPSFNATTTIYAAAIKGSAWSAVAEQTFTKATVLTVAEAIALIPNKDDVENDQYVAGIVCTAAPSLLSGGKLTYYISADGSETNRLQIYKGKNLNNTEFTAVSDLAIGDRVTVFGQLKNFNNTPEMNDGNYLVSKETPAVAAPVFSPDGGGFMGETDVTISCATASSSIYYTLDGSAPSKLSTLYESAIHLTATTTINAIAYVGDDASLVIAKTFTLTAPMTVAEALAALDSENPINNVAVSGIISTAPTANPSSGKLTYFISDDGSASDELEVYKGFGVAGASFSDKTDLQVGDQVTVFGNLTIFNSTTKEFAEGNRLLAFNRPQVAVTDIDLTESTAEVEVGKTVTLHASVVPANATNKTIVWSVQSGDTYASVDENGVVTGIAAGEAVIRAASDEDATLFAECTVTVTEPAPLSPWASVYTSNVAMAHTGSGVDNGTITIGTDDPYLLVKAGASSSTGTIVVTVPKGTTDLHFHAFAWGGKTAKIELAGVENASVSEFDLAGEAGASGSGNDFTLQGDPVDQYFHVSFDAVAAETEITFSKATGSADNRFFFYGVNQEGGLILESISVSGTATALEYNDGDHFSPAGLGVTGHYSDASTAPITEGIVWAFDPDPLTQGTTSVSVTATAGGFTSAAFVVEGLTVAGAAPLSPWASVYTSNVTMAHTGSGVDNGTITIGTDDPYLLVKAGASSSTGTIVVTVPKGTTDLHFHAFAWGGKTAKIELAGVENASVSEFDLAGEAGASGSGNDFTLQGDPVDQYFHVSFDAVAAETEITFSKATGSADNRFFFYGVNQEGGVVPVLESIEISGDLTNKSGYKVGDDLDLDGLTVEATYSIGGVAQTPVDITDKLGDGLTLTYDPLVENQTEVTITATYGDKSDDITITGLDPVASADPAIYVDPSLTVNFGSVEVGEAVPANKTITVTLTNVAAATATLGGTNPEAFSIDKTALVDGDVVTISVIASTAAAASYSATITITDDAAAATEKVVNLSFAVTEPAVEETPVSTTSKWVPATEIADGMQVLIVGERNEKIYAVGAQTSNNRTAVEGSLSEGVFTPGENTMAFTVVAQEGGTYALQASNGKYLYAAGSGSGKNFLRSQDEVDDNAKWTLSVSSATANGTNTNNKLQLNNSSDIFSCYSSTQKAIQFYVPKPVEPDYTTVRTGLNAGDYYTMCLDKAVTAVQGGSIWRVVSKADGSSDIILEEVTGNLDAGRPYIFLASAADLKVAYTGDAVGAPVNDAANNGLIGSFSKQQIAQSDDHYIIYNNALYYVNSDNVFVGAYRAYLDMTGVPAYSSANLAPGRRRVTMAAHGPQTATGIEDLNASEKPMKMMINGQIFILRGEKMYDTTGRLVK